ncbi:hypothetical protein [uncultured Corynebacterium sp.]|uniref:hypothetical protein n=1 Tax=uncultured Corynebacterium sp. TaxID=159447 RepID=UPI0025E864C7|nr:hypothetical protein [uncultured Corynebacterium sp.]
MTTQLMTTYFVAHPDDVGKAYQLYRSRVESLDLEVVAMSPAPVPMPQDSEYESRLWDLRLEAAYSALDNPEEMALYHVNSLVRIDADADTTAQTLEQDAVVEKFFFEDDDAPTVFPGFLSPVPVTLHREPTGELKVYRVFYLGQQIHADAASALFSKVCADVAPVVCSAGLEAFDHISHSVKIGPLQLRDAQLSMAQRGDGFSAASKVSWEGWFITEAEFADVAGKVHDSEDPVVLASLEVLPF